MFSIQETKICIFLTLASINYIKTLTSQYPPINQSSSLLLNSYSRLKRSV